MSSNDPRNGVLSKLVEALAKMAERLPDILRYTLAIIILLIIPLLLGIVIPPEIMLLIWLLAALGLVGYILFEVLVLKPRQAEPSTGAPPATVEPEPAVEPRPEPTTPAPAAPEPPALDPTAARLAYLRRLRTVCNTLMLQYIDPESFQSDKVRQQVMALADVYTTLDTTTQVRVEPEEGKERRRRERRLGEPDQETRPLTALEAAAGNRQMVLVGDPGSGKSTFVKYLALCLGGEGLEPGHGWLGRLQPHWTHGPLLPLLVVLRDFASSTHCDGTAKGLWQFIARDLDLCFSPGGAYARRGRRACAL